MSKNYKVKPKTGKFYNYDSPADLLAVYDPLLQSGEIGIYKWQLDFLRAFARERVSYEDIVRCQLIAANGSGKSRMILAPAVIWVATQYDQSLCVVTSSSAEQMQNQTERFIRMLAEQMNIAHQAEYGTDVWEIKHRHLKFIPTGSYIDLFVTDEAKRAEGRHPLATGCEFCVFIDEAKSISEEIFAALYRCHGMTRRMDVSSPGATVGHFYEIATKEDAPWHVKVVTAYDCLHIKDSEIEEMIRVWGIHDPVVRSSLFAQFTSSDVTTVISKEVLMSCIREFTPNKRLLWGEPRAGLDLAAGGDENVLSVWHGNVQIGQESFRQRDTNFTAVELIELFRKYNLSAKNIYADDGGVGRGIIDNIRGRGWPIRRVINNSVPNDRTRYRNRGTEIWFNFKRFVEDGLVEFRNDEKLFSQLYNRYYFRPDNDKLRLESKPEAKKNGHPSPDRADACVLAWSAVKYPININGVSSQPINPREGIEPEKLTQVFRALRRPNGTTLGSGGKLKDTIYEGKFGQGESLSTTVRLKQQQRKRRFLNGFNIR